MGGQAIGANRVTKRRIVILGCGYVGSALGKLLVSQRHDVIGTTTSPDRADDIRALGIQPELTRLADSNRIHELLLDRDTVYLTVAAKGQDSDYRSVYVDGARSLIKAVAGTPVERIIYTSSTRVYHQKDGSWVDEQSDTEAWDDRSEALLDAERILLGQKSDADASTPLQVTVVRLSGIYGPGRDLIARIRKAAGGQRHDGDQYVNLIHRDDIVSALAALIDLPHHGVFVLSDNQPLRRRDLYDRVLSAAGLPAITWLAAGQPVNRGKRVRNDLIRQSLGLELEHSGFAFGGNRE